MKRLPLSSTERIDRNKRLGFTYQRRSLQGFEGDTVATALLANGFSIFSRSFKYHRPRGLFSLDGESSGCLMRINHTPNVRAEQTLLREGMFIEAQNVWGTPEADKLAFVGGFAKLLPTGFYYKMFHRPYRLWPFFQNRLRNLAGLGSLDSAWKDDIYDNLFLNADVCVVGGGPAGMSAALAAAEEGVRVFLLDARPWLGGFYDWRARAYQGQPLYARSKDLATRVRSKSSIRVLLHTSLIGFYANNHLTARQIGGVSDPFVERYLEIRAKAVVVATGCTERALVFENNDRPGIMVPNCAERLARTWALLPGQRAVFSVSDDLGLEAALSLSELGLEIPAISDSRQLGQNQELLAHLKTRDIPVLKGVVVQKAEGKHRVQGAQLVSLQNGSVHRYKCNLLVGSAGQVPALGPLILAKAKLAYDEKKGFFLPSSLPEGVLAAGRMIGLNEPQAIETSGTLAGLKAAQWCGSDSASRIREEEQKLRSLTDQTNCSTFVKAPRALAQSFVCFDEDVTVKDVLSGCDEGFDSVELNKRWTTAGMGPSQGGTSGLNLPFVLSEHLGKKQGEILPSHVRSPLSPTLLATYAGRNYHVYKRTPLHEAQERAGGIFRLVGVWKRPRYFSTDFTCREEVRNVHENVGLIDVSTLGKFRLFGPDALKALQKLYIGDMSKIVSGRAKYAAMVNEDGCLIDDGVVMKMAENDYYFTTSTARAAQTAEWFRYHTRYESWDYKIVNLTDCFGAINLAGPRSREVLRQMTEADISNEAVPYMAFQEIVLKNGIPARLLRVGFVGEMGFELHVPSSFTESVWNLLLEVGKPFGISPFALEAQNVLRLEKGHLIIGIDTELRVNLNDLGMGFLWDRNKKTNTIGVPALRQTENQPGRMKLVGFKTENPDETPPDGAIIVEKDIRGHVTSSRFSHILNASIGLALVEGSMARIGGGLKIFKPDMNRKFITATIVKPPFYDSEGNRLRM